MKLLTIRDARIRYGAENHMLRVACGVARHGIEVHAAFPRAPGMVSMIRDCEAAGISYWPFELNGRFGPLPKDGSLSPCLQMLRLLKDVKPDVVQFTAAWPTEVWAPAWSCALRNVPLLAVFQLAPEKAWLSRLRLKQLAWARRRRQRWMAVSQQNLLALRQTFAAGPNEIGILYNGTEIEPAGDLPDEAETEALRRDVRTELAMPPETRLLLTTARLEPQKGHVNLLQIMSRVIDEFPDVRFVWAGDGGERQALETRVQQQGLGSHVRFLGYRTDIHRLLRASDLFVFPSHFEGGCSSSIREAMARRLPIVCSDAGGIPEILHNGCHALVFRVQDNDGMLAQLRDALRHPAKMHALAEQARERIEEFSSDRMVDNYSAVFRELCGAEKRYIS
jgi:glycosyltransferase involved in cell wall biosynthesis